MVPIGACIALCLVSSHHLSSSVLVLCLARAWLVHAVAVGRLGMYGDVHRGGSARRRDL